MSVETLDQIPIYYRNAFDPEVIWILVGAANPGEKDAVIIEAATKHLCFNISEFVFTIDRKPDCFEVIGDERQW